MNIGTQRMAVIDRGSRIGMAAIALLLAGTPALGDDIELFVSTNNQTFQCEAPNVLFLIDTSGSMDALVETQEPWDAGTNYAGCYNSHSFYYDSAGATPECDSTAMFARPANFCSAMQNTEYTGEFQAWDSSNERWVKLADADVDWPVECAADEGIHGDGLSSDTYAVDGPQGPWSGDATARISWAANASAVTIFDGNWLNWLSNPPTVSQQRLDIVKDVTKSTLDNMTNVNVGLMTFNATEGGSIRFATEDIETAREPMKAAIDDLAADGQTPLSESLFELGEYLRGASIIYGIPPEGDSVAESRVGGNLTSGAYLSPLNSTGQNTYIVLLTDGEPANDTSANRLIEALPEYGTLVGQPCDDAVDGSCLDAMSEYLHKVDLRPGVEGQQNAITHTIGFGIDLDLLKRTAERGGGKYFIVDNTASLTSALSNLATDFARSASLLTPPRIPINSFNQAERLDNVYVSLFEPSANQHWPGNLKQYRLRRMGRSTILVDAYGNNVIDPLTGFFRDTAVSFWSAPLVDGAVAPAGGAASQLPSPDDRKILSNVNELALDDVSVGNTDITAAMVGAPDAERDTTIEWARGFDARDVDEDTIVDEPRQSIGDPLHVQPVTIAYGTDENNSNAVVYVMTNDGYLHAINAVDGVELWSFIPRRLLTRLYELSLEQPSINKEYGLDGALHFIEVDGKKILVLGMRRGGNALFAMDVTIRNTPKLLWVLDRDDPEFRDLGQTWSPVTPARVAVGSNTQDVILFTGGYDGGQDGRDFRTDATGNAIYMVNTISGELVWSAGSDRASSNHDLDLERMDYSIPGGLRALDDNQDGLTDRVYFGDMGGQVWRIDFVNGQGAATLGEGGVLASLGGADLGAPTRADARRFYTTPDVVDVIHNDRLFTAINIGSGYRAHPLDSATDEEFYSIRDFRTQEVIPTELYGSESLPIVTRADLPDITDNVTPLLEDSDPGWRLRLEGGGEKVLSSSLTLSNVLFFTSFTPTSAASSCQPGGGLNRLYRVSVLNGSPLTNLDASVDDDTLTKEDRYVDVGRPMDVPLELSFGPDGPCAGLDCFDGEDELAGEDGDEDDDGDGDLGGLEGPRAKETYWFPVTRQ